MCRQSREMYLRTGKSKEKFFFFSASSLYNFTSDRLSNNKKDQESQSIMNNFSCRTAWRIQILKGEDYG